MQDTRDKDSTISIASANTICDNVDNWTFNTNHLMTQHTHAHTLPYIYTTHSGRTHIQRQYSEGNVAHTKKNKETIVINHLEIEVKGRAGDSEEIHMVVDGGKKKAYVQQNGYTSNM